MLYNDSLLCSGSSFGPEPPTTGSFLRPGLRLYPNPASHSVTIRLPQEVATGPRHLRLLDLQGRELLRQRWPEGQYSLEVSLKDLPYGLLLLEVWDESGWRVSRKLDHIR